MGSFFGILAEHHHGKKAAHFGSTRGWERGATGGGVEQSVKNLMSQDFTLFIREFLFRDSFHEDQCLRTT